MNYQGLETTKAWFEAAIPEPTTEQACTQIGCHYEEFGEMANALCDYNLGDQVDDVSYKYKTNAEEYLNPVTKINSKEKEELLDSLADQIVTAVGVAHMLGMDILGALGEVNRSNFSKFEDGKPVFDGNGKITKGKDYSKPDLSDFV